MKTQIRDLFSDSTKAEICWCHRDVTQTSLQALSAGLNCFLSKQQSQSNVTVPAFGFLFKINLPTDEGLQRFNIQHFAQTSAADIFYPSCMTQAAFNTC